MTLTVRLPPDVKERLTRPAASTRRTRSFLAAEAIADDVDREIEIIDGIEHGLDDMRHGRLVPHEEAVARIDATILDAKKKRR